VTRNPAYAEIKASIRERGLDAPPAITRRPGEAHYIIRNGGNTRLAILRELWSETKEERFFRIPCLFRPWPARGEIVALTGHLAENELRGGLSFIERALGIEKAREFYEQESGQALSQSELARRLTADGFRCRSHTSAACTTPCATCCRRSRRCCTADSAGIRWTGSRCCARPASAPGSGVRTAAP
jgi:ParB family protein of integrating conjugative element (PFGI_1 class)